MAVSESTDSGAGCHAPAVTWPCASLSSPITEDNSPASYDCHEV